MNMERALTIQETAQHLGVSSRTVGRWLHGGLASVRIGGVRRVLPQDLDKFVAKHSSDGADGTRFDPTTSGTPT